VIYDSTVPEGTGECVYVKVKVYELADPKEIKQALKYLYGRKSKTPRGVEEFWTIILDEFIKLFPKSFG